MDIGRRIVCSANRDKHGNVWLGIRHCDKFMNFAGRSAEEQGFVDNKGDWHTREQAYVIAKEANQIIRRCGGDEGRLFSENLY